AYALPSTLYEGRYLVGGAGAFDLEAGTQVPDWNPEPSRAPQSGIVVGHSVVFSGAFTYLHGTPANHIAAVDRDLAPVPGFRADLGADPSWLSALGIADGRVIAVGSINTLGG